MSKLSVRSTPSINGFRNLLSVPTDTFWETVDPQRQKQHYTALLLVINHILKFEVNDHPRVSILT